MTLIGGHSTISVWLKGVFEARIGFISGFPSGIMPQGSQPIAGDGRLAQISLLKLQFDGPEKGHLPNLLPL